MKRKSISNKVRFEVLKRDDFSCHYCGAKPPEVRLEVDHIEPIARGGSNDESNLVAACERCNCGKRDIPLGQRWSPATTIHSVYRNLVFRAFEAVESGDPNKLASARKVLFKFNWCESLGYYIKDGDIWPDQWTGLPNVELVEEALRTMTSAEIESFLIDVYLNHTTLSVRPCDYANTLLCQRLGKAVNDELASN